MAKVVKKGCTLCRVLINYHGEWRLESQGVEYSDKMVYFANPRGQFSDYRRQIPIEEVRRLFGWSPAQARLVAMNRQEHLMNHHRKLALQAQEDLSAISILRDPTEE
jgi:hypothetical protein